MSLRPLPATARYFADAWDHKNFRARITACIWCCVVSILSQGFDLLGYRSF